MTPSLIATIFLLICCAAAEPLKIRVVAANLTSDKNQSYSPTNGNHSNPKGAGARILAALKPDIVLIQEFNTSNSQRQWVQKTFGPGYTFTSEKGKQIPNGIITRFPILSHGSWDDPELENREFAWAKLALPENRELWAASVHLHSKGAESRKKQAAALAKIVQLHIPKDALLIIGGDLNTRSLNEACFQELAAVCTIPTLPPVCDLGNTATNSPRNRPYDWVLFAKSINQHEIPVTIGDLHFPHGLVFDTRVFQALAKTPPAQLGDSAVPFMQHMAVVRDFQLPAP